jgi:ABC-type branched-subunit amino acid transport system permease subunit
MLILVFIYGIVAIGLNILIGYAGQFARHAALMAMGAYISAGVSKSLEGSVIGDNGTQCLAGDSRHDCRRDCGAVLAFPAMRPKGPYLAMVTIAFGWMVWRNLLEWVSVTGGDLGITSSLSLVAFHCSEELD